MAMHRVIAPRPGFRVPGKAEAPQNGHHSFPISAVAAVIAVVALLLLGVQELREGRTTLLLASTAALAVSVILYRTMGALQPDLVTPRLLTLYYGLQILWLLLIALLDITTVVTVSSLAPDMSSRPLLAAFPLLLVPFACLLAVAVAWFIWGRSRRYEQAEQLVNRSSQQMGTYLTATGGLLILYWFAALQGSGAIGYVVRVLSTTLLFVPFLVGVFSARFRAVRYFWFVLLAINAGIGLAAGSRFVALLPIVLYIVGYITTLRGWPRRRAIIFTLAGGLAAFFVTGIIGIVRQEIGRGGVEIFSSERVAAVINEAEQVVAQGASGHDLIVSTALTRLLAPTNVAVPMLSPEVIPYRGFEGLQREIVASARIQALSGVSHGEYLEAGLGQGPANAYGFLVDETNAFEFGILPDGWSRGGPLVVLLFGFSLTLVYIASEKLARRRYRNNPAAFLLLLAVVAKSVFLDAGVFPLLHTLRSLILGVGLIAVLVGAINTLHAAQRKPVRMRA